MVFQSQKTGCVWKTPFRKFGHIIMLLDLQKPGTIPQELISQ